jgi:DNA helicase-2/ATP-dependent DNA helicase PcrA
MIHILAQGSTGSTIVADDDQSIYRFRGAIRENVLKIKELLKAEEIVIGANFRSDKVIVDAAESLIGHEANRTPKDIEAVSINSGYLYKCKFPNPTAEAEQVVKWIGELISQKQVKDLGEIAIITRAQYRAKYVLEEMDQAKISWFDRSRLKFQDSWETALGLAILSLACDLNSSDRLHLLVSAIEDGGLAFRLGDKDALDLALQIRDRLVASIPLNAIPENAKIILDIAKCEQIIYKVCWSDTDARRLLKNLDVMIAVITQEAQSLRHNLNDTINRLAGYGAVQVMSGHGAKGREFDQVFLVGLEDDVLPIYHTHNNENDIAEERRIFYVALTRTRKAAYLTSAETRDNRNKKQSRFINHIPKELFSPLPPLTKV